MKKEIIPMETFRTLAKISGVMFIFYYIFRVYDVYSMQTHYVKLFDRNFFDMVYLDASKYHEDVTKDLDSWYPLVKYSGLLCCSNYENIEDKFSIQVNDAVNKFCIKNNLFISYMTFEKNSFFAISKPNLKLF